MLLEEFVRTRLGERFRTGDIERVAYASAGRAVHRVGREVFVKAYEAGDFAAFELEKSVAQAFAERPDSLAPPLLAHERTERVAFLAFGRADGAVLNDLYRGWSQPEYEAFALRLGQALGAVHRTPLPLAEAVRMPRGADSWLLREAKGALERGEENLRFLAESGLIAEGDAERARAFVASAEGRVFDSPEGLAHGDIHNENVFFNPESGACSLIDWETAAIVPRGLDLAHPFLNILGEGFAGRRLEAGGPRLLEAFARGYGEAVDWEAVACHGLAWYLDKAAEAFRAGKPGLGGFFLKTGLGGMDLSLRPLR